MKTFFRTKSKLKDGVGSCWCVSDNFWVTRYGMRRKIFAHSRRLAKVLAFDDTVDLHFLQALFSCREKRQRVSKIKELMIVRPLISPKAYFFSLLVSTRH